ncbi:MAG: 2Fe-2S iron-sulfur cluster-binding protein [Polyangia bacterium]|jgi:predicted molibdopterin-dependent oxidoreductase YjgC|nr:2Fe-2S iron-sulfur cluster-binding protein [Polyangia bacterium]
MAAKPESKMVPVVVNGEEREAPLHAPLLDWLRGEGFEVPSLCHNPALTQVGACRLCLVEVSRGGRRPRLTTSCNYPVLSGLEVRTDTDRVRRMRRGVLELLLELAPGSRELRDLAVEHGVLADTPRTRDAERCIRCGLCVRVCAEIVGAEALCWSGRGEHRRVGTPFDDWTEQCIGCGACASLCPTGAIHMEEEAVARFIRRAGPDRLCRYALLGLAPGAICSSSYQCWRCEVEQELGGGLGLHAAFQRLSEPPAEVLAWRQARGLGASGPARAGEVGR